MGISDPLFQLVKGSMVSLNVPLHRAPMEEKAQKTDKSRPLKYDSGKTNPTKHDLTQMSTKLETNFSCWAAQLKVRTGSEKQNH